MVATVLDTPALRAIWEDELAGMRVRIKAGPLQGLEGWVERRQGMTTVLLRLDFINRAAAVKIDADQLTPT